MPLDSNERMKLSELLIALGKEIQAAQATLFTSVANGSAKPLPRAPLPELSLLIVEEDLERRQLLERFLTPRASRIHACRTPEEALQILQTTRPDLILATVALPALDGYALCQQIRALPDLKEIPMLLCSPQSEQVDKVRAIQAGADEMISLSAGLEALYDKIYQLVMLSRPRPPRVVIVDDDPDILRYTGQNLARAGLQAHLVQDPEQALPLLKEIRPDLLVLDIDMPQLDGLEVCRQVRALEDFQTLPILFLTARQDETTKLAGFQAGADDYLTKPFGPRELIARLQTRLARNALLAEQGSLDSLTRLHNRQRFQDRLIQTIGEGQRYQRSFCLAMLDIDDFKKINDTYGHPAGDLALQTLAQFLKRRLRRSDVIARYGGDEFSILFPEIAPGDCHALISILIEQFRQERCLPAVALAVTFSAGIAESSAGAPASSELIRRADYALYQAKQSGKSRACLFQTA